MFAPGVLTGAPSSGLGRHGVGAKSPLSGGYGKSEVGGYYGKVATANAAGLRALAKAVAARMPVVSQNMME